MFESIDPVLQRQPAYPRRNHMIDDSCACRKQSLVNLQRVRLFSHSMILSIRYPIRAKTIPAVLFLLAALLCPIVRGADKDNDKDKKPEKEKKEKIEPWVEVRTAHFIVASDGGEKTARRIAEEFESLLRVFQSTMPNSRVSTGIPVRILAARNGESFARVAPEFPYDKRHEQPPGLMVSGVEKTYIGIRANASGRFPFIDIFQNYARQVMKLSYRNLPPWLEEGYSTVYGNVTFTDRGLRLERPDPEDLSVLFESPLLPLDLVLHVDRTSGYYSPGNKQSVYFAESRVLLHYLISDPQFAGTKSMERYVTAVQGGADSLQAAREAFGDLNQLQAKLDAFVKNVSGPPAEIPVNGSADSGGAPRTLTAPEIEARIADFQAIRGRSGDAQDKLEEALMSEPTLAEAEQSLGFLLLRENNADEAQKHFERAAQLDPKDALNFYGLGLVAVSNGGKADVPARALEAFEKAAALNPDFAPAWYNLAMIYSQRTETLQKALSDAQHAAALVPGDSGYQLQVAALLDRSGHPEEARKTAAQVQENASDRATANKAGDLVARMSKPQPSAAPPAPVGNAPARPPSDSGVRIERKTEPEAKPPASSTAPANVPATPKPEPSPAPKAPLFSATKVYSMVGTITDVTCAIAPQIQLTLKSLTIVMKLHASDLAKLSFKSGGSDAAPKGSFCSTLRGRSARISYVLVLNQPWDGEMQEVEFRNQP
jgi:tetratricopeptide (TPR) repeat protein